MKNPIKSYQFWFKIIGAALLLVLGIWLLIDNTSAKFLVLMFTGIIAGAFALIRIIPLIRTLKSGRSKIVCLVEIILHLALAVYLIFAALSIKSDPEAKFSKFNDENYRFFIAFFFYSRAVAYFICTVLYKEETDKTKFWVHIVLITVAAVLCALTDITSQAIAISIAVIAFLCSLGLMTEGAVGYGRYRKQIVKERNDQKQEEVVEETTIEAPTHQEIIPMIDENEQQDSTQVS